MKTVDIIYFIEHIARELDIACIVKHLCESKYGLTVKIASLPYEASTIIYTHRPRLVVTPFFYSAEIDVYNPSFVSHWKDAAFLNLYYEQYFSKINKEFKHPKGWFAKNEVYHHAWSTVFSEYLIRHGVKKDNIFVNGNPSFVLYQKPYSNYFADRETLAKTYGIDEKKKWLFFPMNYAWAFRSDSSVEGFIKRGFDPVFAYEYRELCKESLQKVVSWWEQASKNDDIELIVRPRPAIPRQKYLDVFKETVGLVPQRVHLIKEGSIREWILASDVVFSSYSTSLLEAVVAKKPAYILEPIKFPDWHSSDWYDLVPHINNVDSFIEICSIEPDANTLEQVRAYLYENGLSQDDAVANIARFLNGMCRNLKKDHYANKSSANPLMYMKGLFNRVKQGKKVKPKAENDIFTENDIVERTRKWRNVLTDSSFKG